TRRAGLAGLHRSGSAGPLVLAEALPDTGNQRSTGRRPVPHRRLGRRPGGVRRVPRTGSTTPAALRLAVGRALGNDRGEPGAARPGARHGATAAAHGVLRRLAPRSARPRLVGLPRAAARLAARGRPLTTSAGPGPKPVRARNFHGAVATQRPTRLCSAAVASA